MNTTTETTKITPGSLVQIDRTNVPRGVDIDSLDEYERAVIEHESFTAVVKSAEGVCYAKEVEGERVHTFHWPCEDVELLGTVEREAFRFEVPTDGLVGEYPGDTTTFEAVPRDEGGWTIKGPHTFPIVKVDAWGRFWLRTLGEGGAYTARADDHGLRTTLETAVKPLRHTEVACLEHLRVIRDACPHLD